MWGQILVVNTCKEERGFKFSERYIKRRSDVFYKAYYKM